MNEPSGTTIERRTRAARYREILGAMTRHGLSAAHGDAENAARNVREACEELGTTFIKLGQLLSMRSDLVPPAFRIELAKLQDDVPPIAFEVVRDVIEGELGESLDELFVAFDREPLACASIGQVHAARLTDGRDVVVKVRKPGIREDVELDLEILTQLAGTSERLAPYLADYDVPGLVEEFSDTLRGELDYRREARNIETFEGILGDRPGVELPRVIAQYSTSRVLTLTRVGGEKLPDAVPPSRVRRDDAAQRIAAVIIEPALTNGIFHADPHAGNILVRDDGSVAIVDFGMVGYLSDELRRQTADLFLAFSRQEAERIADRLLLIAPARRPIDRGAIVDRLRRLVDRHLRGSIERGRMGEALGDIVELVREYRLQMPMSLAMFFKAIALAEGLILELAPNEDVMSFLQPIAGRVAFARLDPSEWAQRVRFSAMEAADLSIDLPRRADRVLSDLERGNLRVWTRLEDLDPLLARLERIVERANATMLAAACIVAMTVLFVVYRPSGWHGVVAAIFWVALVVAVGWSARTVWATIRRR